VKLKIKCIKCGKTLELKGNIIDGNVLICECGSRTFKVVVEDVDVQKLREKV